jgi:hypothetical protein
MTFTGYSINGIALHDQSRGWRILRDGTNTQGGVTKTLGKVPSPGRPGYTPAPSTYTEQAYIFVVRTTRAGLEPLLALCAAATTLSRTDDPTKEAYVELASALPAGDAPMDAMFDVTITLVAYEGVWRDVTAVTVGPTTIASPTQTLTMLNGLSAPVFDAQVFIRGVFGEFTLTDSGGSFLKTTRAWPGTSTTGLLFVGTTNQAFLANESSPWTPVSDMTQYIDVSGNGGFRLTSQLVSGNPANRQVSLSLTTLTQTSTTFRLQAKRAYRMN